MKIESCAISHDQFPQNTEADELATRRIADPSQSLIGVYRYYDRWHVRTFISKRQCVLAKGSVHACIRFADAALLYFWHYRKRPNREPVDTDFNLGLSFARYDLEHCEWLSDFLRTTEAEMIASGFLSAADRRAPSKTADVFRRDVFLLDLENFKRSSKKFVRELRLLGEPAKFIHDTLVEGLDVVFKSVDSADRQFIRPASFKQPDISENQIM